MNDFEDRDKMWDMKIHDGYEAAEGIYVIRVPGGWIYKIYELDYGRDRNAPIYHNPHICFVPYCDVPRAER